MGAENSVLEGCEWGDPVQAPPILPWQLTPVTKPDGSAASVFEPKNAEGKDGDLLRKAASTLKGIRHPNVVRFIECGDTSESFWLATESVSPLMTAVPDMSSAELCAGLYDLLQGLDFLHSKLGMCHNNLCLSSVYVAPDGVWKLGGLEHACSFKLATQDYLDKCRAFRVEDSLAPEEKASNVKADPALGHARDVFAFGVLVDALMDFVLEKDQTSQMLEQQLSLCVNSDPTSRPKVTALLGLPVFQNDLIDIVVFLKNITLKSDTEKKLFFCNLLSRLRHFSETVIVRRLVLLLLSRFVLLDEWADRMVLPQLLRPRLDSSEAPLKSAVETGVLSESMFQSHVIGHLYNVFHVHDSHIRLVLLQHFQHYVHLFSRQQLEVDIFLQVLIGLRDTDDKMVSASLRALADLVPILGGDFVIGGSRKPFFFHGLPKQVSPEELQQMEVPKNLNSIMSSHKPLLKDLASGGKSKPYTEMEKEKQSAERERKNREREQRREEARLKREERRRRLKEKQLEAKEGDVELQTSGKETLSQNGVGPPDFLTIEQMAKMDGDDQQLTALEKTKLDADLGTDRSKVADTDRSKVTYTDRSKVTDSDRSKVADSEDNDWSDLEEHIDDEIEAELSNMPSTVDGGSKVQTSPSPYRSHSPPSPPPVKVDWSDIPEADRGMGGPVHSALGGQKDGPLQLGHSLGNVKNSLSRSESDWGAEQRSPSAVDAGDWGDDSWGDSNTPSPVHAQSGSSPPPATSNKQSKSLKLVSAAKSNKSKTKTSSAATSAASAAGAGKKLASEDGLGIGYDIKSIEIVTKSVVVETDFFADMAPVLPEKSSKEIGGFPVGGSSVETGSPSVPKTKMFAVADAAEEVSVTISAGLSRNCDLEF
ncbi:uncharacterized protein LOC101853875 [Aplysia californica]|uniref:Uncharacterized protein LOC101853875 n=1 Tax=Aplysia californica TaxID=6500 RepID=A0ABM0JZ60_APLCA|nr:uncharacterized protein LOC101853875 [Aplysia californica]